YSQGASGSHGNRKKKGGTRRVVPNRMSILKNYENRNTTSSALSCRRSSFFMAASGRRTTAGPPGNFGNPDYSRSRTEIFPQGLTSDRVRLVDGYARGDRHSDGRPFSNAAFVQRGGSRRIEQIDPAIDQQSRENGNRCYPDLLSPTTVFGKVHPNGAA